MIYITDFVNSSINAYNNDRVRYPPDAYDAGEILTCSVFGKNFYYNSTGPTPVTYLEIIEEDKNGRFIRRIT